MENFITRGINQSNDVFFSAGIREGKKAVSDPEFPSVFRSRGPRRVSVPRQMHGPELIHLIHLPQFKNSIYNPLPLIRRIKELTNLISAGRKSPPPAIPFFKLWPRQVKIIWRELAIFSAQGRRLADYAARRRRNAAVWNFRRIGRSRPSAMKFDGPSRVSEKR